MLIGSKVEITFNCFDIHSIGWYHWKGLSLSFPKLFFRLKIGWILRKLWAKMLWTLTAYFGGARGHFIQSTLLTVLTWVRWLTLLCIQCCVKATNTTFNPFDMSNMSNKLKLLRLLATPLTWVTWVTIKLLRFLLTPSTSFHIYMHCFDPLYWLTLQCTHNR